MYAKILVAYDGSEPARRALAQAKHLSEAFGSKLEIVHVYAYPTFAFGEALVPIPQNYEVANYEYAQQVVQEAKARTQDNPNASVTLLQGHPAKSLIDHANESHCDLIIIGSRGLGGFKEFMLGSVSHNVVQHTKIPVLIVR
jgi:nucleotide-binding universal stress UspA family protein